ncbi:MAG: 8-amino-7-oxononanoate synthase [Gammaproteobacteria bacterium]|nr:8-amino-7-oxononanoate synthase [Gammaproteobacteria bacterium]
MAFQRLATRLAQQQDNHGYRQRRAVAGGNQRLLSHQQQSYLNFSSNDYLGLACAGEVKLAAVKAVNQYGAGCGGSPLVTGHSTLHQYLEDLLKDLTGQAAVMLYTSGFAANSGVIETLLSKDDYLVQDKLNHASLMDAGVRSAAKMNRFVHNDLSSLNQQLSSRHALAATDRLVVTEGIFSMDGDSAPLAEISEQCQRHQSWLMVDDAHGFGIYGDGAGSCAEAGVSPDILMATFGKAIGTSGAFVAADSDVIDYLVNFCRHYIYSTSLSPMVVGATIASIKLSQQPWRRLKLEENIDYFRQQASLLGLALMPTTSAIQPIIIGDSARAMAIAMRLREQGIWLTAIRPPTVAMGSARLRITLSTEHQRSDIDILLQTLAQALELTEQ